MTEPVTALRLLPWLSAEGKPCYVASGSEGGHVSRLADGIEAMLVATGTDVLVFARKVLDDPKAPCTEVLFAGVRLAECLSDVLRVAESRGMRLPGASHQASGKDTGSGGST